MIDEKARQEILTDDESILVTAGAGSGKTTILTKKIIHDIDNQKKHYKIAAITFTRKAANEIKEKISKTIRGHFIGTNDSFVEQEIIKPFIQDAFGAEYSPNFEVIYHSDKFRNFNEGLDLIKNSNKLGTYEDTKRNFKFELAYQILLKSRVARQYLQSRYFKIYVDEYQDCDNDMHTLFMYLKNQLNIKLFIVGDPKQCIYEWRGANPNLFNELNNTPHNNFSKYELKENFRCHVDIQNYSNIIERENMDYYQDVTKVKNVTGVNNIIEALDSLDLTKETTLLLRIAKTRYREVAREIEQSLNDQGYSFVYIPRTPLDELSSQNTFILVELANYAKNPEYTIYNLINILPFELSNMEIKELNQIIRKLKDSNIDKDDVEVILTTFFERLGVPLSNSKEIETFCTTILDPTYDNTYNGRKYIHKIMTIHSSKGLEFEQVIIYSSDFQIHNGRDKREHYVATTRAKKQLVVILDNNLYFEYLKKIIEQCGLEDSLDQIIKIL